MLSIHILSLLSAFLIAGTHAAPAAVCSQLPYLLLLPLSSYAPAQTFCRSYDPITVTTTSTFGVVATTTTSVTSTVLATTTTTTTTTSTSTSSYPVTAAAVAKKEKRAPEPTAAAVLPENELKARQLAGAVLLSSLTNLPKATISTLCSCIEVPFTATTTLTTTTSTNVIPTTVTTVTKYVATSTIITTTTTSTTACAATATNTADGYCYSGGCAARIDGDVIDINFVGSYYDCAQYCFEDPTIIAFDFEISNGLCYCYDQFAEIYAADGYDYGVLSDC